MNKLNKIIPLLILSFFLLFSLATASLAVKTPPGEFGGPGPDYNSSGSQQSETDKSSTSASKYKILDCTTKTVQTPSGETQEVTNDCDLNDFGRTLNSIAKMILGLTGSLALLMFVYGGFTWVISSGNREMIQKGKNILVAAVIGIIIVFVAYSAIEFTLRALTGQTDLTKNKDVIFFQGSNSSKEWNQ